MMKARGNTIFIGVILLPVLVSICSSRMCSPEYHPYTDYVASRTEYERKEFKKDDSGNYSQIVLDTSRNIVVVGGRNYVFMLTSDKLYPFKTKKWISERDEKKCLQKGMSKMDCQNTIQLMTAYKDKLLICGSSSLNPVYNITELTNIDHVVEGNRNGFGKCSAKPSLRVVGSVTRMGELIAGTFGDPMGNDPMISGSFMTSTPKREEALRTERWNKKMLHDPEFIDSFAVYPSVYILFNEKAKELNGEVHATIARICQGDNGGSDFVLENTWTTFRKARLSCAAKGKPEVKFNLLKSVTWSEITKMFYAVFVTSEKNLPGSTICVFSLNEVEQSFEGDFLYSKETGLPWNRTKNNKHFKGCRVNKSSLLPVTKGFLEKKVPEGKQPTNFLKLQALTDAFYYQLMYVKVNRSENINFLRPTVGITQIAIDDIILKNGTMFSIIYLATDYGSIISLYQPRFRDSACILEEVSLFKEGFGHPVRKMVIANKTHEMFIGTDVKVDRLKLYKCERFKTRSDCINARHPVCGWSQTSGKCLTYDNVNFQKQPVSWEQDLSRCPSIRGAWAGWSPWKVCPQQEDREKLCKCRKRRCRSIKPEECKGESVNVKHCSVTKVKSVKSWLELGVIHGSWSQFSPWSKCGEGLCGAEFSTRTRTCTDPRPMNGGMMCVGKNVECQPCGNREQCPSVCEEWSMWSPCRNNSGVTTQQRERICHGAKQCPKETRQVKMCNPKEIVWGPWSVCGCDVVLRNKIHSGIQHRIPACANRCSNVAECQRQLVQYRTCPCIKIKANAAESVRKTKDEEKFEITDIILTAVITGIACFLISAVIVTLLIRRSKSFLNIAGKNERSGIDPEVLRTPVKKTHHINGDLTGNILEQPINESTPLTSKPEIQEMNSSNRNGVSPSISMTESPGVSVPSTQIEASGEHETEKL